MRPELKVRSIAHRLGFRFRLHDRALPGTPDLVFPSLKKVVLVHGCFWHRHWGCALARLPKSRLAFWVPKLEGNRIRDRSNRKKLVAKGWQVLVIWECQLTEAFVVAVELWRFLQGRP
jgi:DNA mismatch endonuclease (patch repair protein)